MSNSGTLCSWGHGSGPLAFMLSEGEMSDVPCCPGCLQVLREEGPLWPYKSGTFRPKRPQLWRLAAWLALLVMPCPK